MRISPVNYNITSFGYNKKLNEELTKKLAQCDDKVFSSGMLSINSTCNSIEDSIRKEEAESAKKKNKNDSKLYEHLDVFLSLKDILASNVAITFPELRFPDREYKHYNSEFVKKGSREKDWRSDVCRVLKEWCETPASETEKPKPASPSQPENVSSSATDNTNKTDDSQKIDSPQKKTSLKRSSVLVQYTPKPSSPKGFDDVAGMTKLKEQLTDSIVQMLNNPEQAKLDFEEYGKKLPRGLMLYGPPGCGKTYITEALSAYTKSPLYMLDIGHAGSYYINQTATNITSAFDEVIDIAKREGKPVLLFMDEVDSLGFNRDRQTWSEDVKQVASLLQSLDRAKDSGVIVLAATNKYDLIDPAIKRRFEERVYVGTPDLEARQELLHKFLKSVKKGAVLDNNPEAIKQIAIELDGFSSDSVCKISESAALNALKRGRADIDIQDFRKAISETSEEKPIESEYKTHQKNVRIGFN